MAILLLCASLVKQIIQGWAGVLEAIQRFTCVGHYQLEVVVDCIISFIKAQNLLMWCIVQPFCVELWDLKG